MYVYIKTKTKFSLVYFVRLMNIDTEKTLSTGTMTDGPTDQPNKTLIEQLLLVFM